MWSGISGVTSPVTSAIVPVAEKRASLAVPQMLDLVQCCAHVPDIEIPWLLYHELLLAVGQRDEEDPAAPDGESRMEK